MKHQDGTREMPNQLDRERAIVLESKEKQGALEGTRKQKELGKVQNQEKKITLPEVREPASGDNLILRDESNRATKILRMEEV